MGAAIGRDAALSICISVACCTVTGTASTTFCASFMRSCAVLLWAVTSQSSWRTLNGTLTCQLTSAAALGSMRTRCVGKAASGPEPVCALTSTSMDLAVALRSVNIARYWSPSRTSGGTPERICRSWVERMRAWPVPNSATLWAAPAPATASATTTMRKPVSASLSGTFTTASPRSSSTTRGFHKSSVSNSSRVGKLPPPPPGGAAFLP